MTFCGYSQDYRQLNLGLHDIFSVFCTFSFSLQSSASTTIHSSVFLIFTNRTNDQTNQTVVCPHPLPPNNTQAPNKSHQSEFQSYMLTRPPHLSSSKNLFATPSRRPPRQS